MTDPPSGPDTDGAVRCTYRERDPETGRRTGPVCGRLLTDPASVALHLGRTHFRRMVGAVGRRKVLAVHEGQLVLDLETDLTETEATEPERATR